MVPPRIYIDLGQQDGDNNLPQGWGFDLKTVGSLIYHFALPVEFGYDAYTVQLYKQEHQGKAPPKNYNNPEWMAWRAAKLTQLMAKINKEVKAVRKDAVISLSPNSPNFAYNKYLQDWRRWANTGLLDEVIVQVYREDLAAIKSELNNNDLLSINNKIPIAIGLYTGPFLKAKSVERLKQEIKIVQKSPYKGVSFFSWETTLWFLKKSSHHQVEQTFRQLFV
ncbi:MAG: family 10 glycosylhydrolase [Calothrix sp. C42_A2020_038]|nr:family 10 glycosylhydrolase [Calothrix sp. C42_A2020_038]